MAWAARRLPRLGLASRSRSHPQNLEPALGGFAPIELCGSLNSVTAQAPCQLRVRKYASEPLLNGGRIGVDDQPRGSDDFRKRAAVGDDYRRATGHRLDRREPEALEEARQAEGGSA